MVGRLLKFQTTRPSQSSTGFSDTLLNYIILQFLKKLSSVLERPQTLLHFVLVCRASIAFRTMMPAFVFSLIKILHK